jgi:hypothetical protein
LSLVRVAVDVDLDSFTAADLNVDARSIVHRLRVSRFNFNGRFRGFFHDGSRFTTQGKCP